MVKDLGVVQMSLGSGGSYGGAGEGEALPCTLW